MWARPLAAAPCLTKVLTPTSHGEVGGGGGSRTRVRKHVAEGLYMRSRV